MNPYLPATHAAVVRAECALREARAAAYLLLVADGIDITLDGSPLGGELALTSSMRAELERRLDEDARRPPATPPAG